jgi:hypothetical protein
LINFSGEKVQWDFTVLPEKLIMEVAPDPIRKIKIPDVAQGVSCVNVRADPRGRGRPPD